MNWETILSRDGPGAWRVAYRILGNRSDADDCLQEAMLGAVRLAQREPVANWAALLKRLSAARAVDRLRQRFRTNRREFGDVVLDDFQGPPADPSISLQDKELQSRLRSCLAQISDDQAQAFCLCCLDDWTYKEAAEHLGISVQAVGVLVHRARQKLKQLFHTETIAARDHALGHRSEKERLS